MLHRILLLLTMIAASICAYFIGMAISIASGFPDFALCAIVFLVFGAWLAGLRNPDRLTLIGASAFVGLLLGWMITPPSIAGVRGVNLYPYILFDLSIEAFLGAVLFSLVVAAVTPRNQLTPLGKRDCGRAAIAVALVGLSLAASVLYLQAQPARLLADWVDYTQSDFQLNYDEPPADIEKQEWDSLVNATAQAVQGCFRTPADVTDRRRFYTFSRKLVWGQTKQDLVWTWDEIEVLSTRGKEYSAKHRPVALSN